MNTNAELLSELTEAFGHLNAATDLMPEGDRHETDRDELASLVRQLDGLVGRLRTAGER